jgi:hypothetical protein
LVDLFAQLLRGVVAVDSLPERVYRSRMVGVFWRSWFRNRVSVESCRAVALGSIGGCGPTSTC